MTFVRRRGVGGYVEVKDGVEKSMRNVSLKLRDVSGRGREIKQVLCR